VDALLEIEKNKLYSTTAWLILAEISIPTTPASTAYLVRNTEDIVFNSNTYTAFPFELDTMRHVSKGEIPSLTLRFANAGRAIQAYLEDYEGLVGQTVTLRIVAKPGGSASYLEARSWTYDILETTADANWVSFTLGAPNPLVRRFPLHRYIANHCNWKFKSVECGYSGSATSCERTLAACQAKNNSTRFGGFPGMGGGNVRLA